MSIKLSLLIVVSLFAVSCVDDDFSSTNYSVASNLCNGLERYSVSILRPGIHYESLKEQYLNSVDNTLNSDEFFLLTKDFLLNFHDPHIWLLSPFEKMYSIDHLGYTKNILFNTIEMNYLDNVNHYTDYIISGTINDNIGYLYVADFKGEVESTKQLFNAIIDGFSNKTGLIIDLRENDGGNAYNAQSLLNKLTDQKLLWHTTQNRTQNGFDVKYEWYINPSGDYQFTKNIVVLTGRYTVSAGERFTIGAKILPHIKIIGDTTANTQGSVMGRELINGWKYTFTFEKCLAPDGTNYEGTGIDPDIYIPSESLDLSNSDKLIERAIAELQ